MKFNIKHDSDHAYLKNLNMNRDCKKNFFLRISNIDRRYCNETDSVSKYDNLMKHLS